MDTPATESSNQPLDTNQAASIFSQMLSPAEPEKKEAPEAEAQAEEDQPQEAPAKEAEAPAEAEQKVTIEVDGKTVELTPAEIAEAYKNGLRQADYTRKTMEAAELRKAADAETAKARQERQQYSQNLNLITAQLQGALQEQSQMDWNALARDDPAKWVEQRNLFEQRQTALQNAIQQQQVIAQQEAAEQAKASEEYLLTQQQELLAKLPEWKDPVKAKGEKAAIAKFLQDSGFEDELIQSISDHRHILVARDAMLYRQMMEKASAANKRVAATPQRVVAPGTSETQGIDRRQQAFQRLSKSGKVEDAASVFASLL